jgi:hypothetical protein
LWTRREGREREPVDVGTRGWSLSFDWIRSAINRGDWFDTMLLTSRSWSWPGASRGDPTAGGRLFSDGAPPPETRGDWPLIPTELVFARRLTLVGDEDAVSSFSARAEEVEEAGSWIFTLRRSMASSLAAPFHLRETAPGRLESDGSSLFAIVCRCLPKEPDPDPSLLQG